MNAMDEGALLDEFVQCARYGEIEEMRSLYGQAPHPAQLVHHQQPYSLNTALHMACANGHIECMEFLLHHGARHDIPNQHGNLPLHWAVHNQQLDAIRLLLNAFPTIDVLQRNHVGHGSLTIAFEVGNVQVLQCLLEHPSACEEKLVEGTDSSNANVKFQDDATDTEESPEAEAEHEPRIVQEFTLEFQFQKHLPIVQAREMAIEWDREVFGSDADQDTTGVTIWSASLILARWIIDLRETFKDKKVLELGAGCGVSGLACYLFTEASHVVQSDYFSHTLKNLQHNQSINQRGTDKYQTAERCRHCNSRESEFDNALMLCGRCEIAKYCSRECQRAHWKQHKLECSTPAAQSKLLSMDHLSITSPCELSVMAIDWSNRNTWPTDRDFDVIIGSDLVYHEQIISTLAETIDGLLQENGIFYHVASQQRHGLIEFKEKMEGYGFQCEVMLVPDAYKQNPLHLSQAELFPLHFNEMDDVYCMYRYQKMGR